MQPHKIVSETEWVAARKAHLAAEKKFTEARDELSRQRRELPWVTVDKPYVFEGPQGKETLAELIVVVGLALLQFILGEGHVVVAIEVAAERRHPLEAPSHPLLERLDLRQRRA